MEPKFDIPKEFKPAIAGKPQVLVFKDNPHRKVTLSGIDCKMYKGKLYVNVIINNQPTFVKKSRLQPEKVYGHL